MKSLCVVLSLLSLASMFCQAAGLYESVYLGLVVSWFLATPSGVLVCRWMDGEYDEDDRWGGGLFP